MYHLVVKFSIWVVYRAIVYVKAISLDYIPGNSSCNILKAPQVH
jgi:hypothetical protein